MKEVSLKVGGERRQHLCPWCGFSYLITSGCQASLDVVRKAYQEHLNEGCQPSLGHVLGSILKASYQPDKGFTS